MPTVFEQATYDVKCEWGSNGITTLLHSADAVIIVDVLSFSTCVSIAVDNGAILYPFHSESITAEEFATQQGALLASKTRQAGAYGLSPTSLLTIPPNTQLVVPSPNGSRLSTLTGEIPTLAGCLRNAQRVAMAAQTYGKHISVIPAGERWKQDGSLRPALEDWIGAGAIIHYLNGSKSPEAQAAEATFLQFQHQLGLCLAQIASGQELIEGGFGEDVQLAGQLNVATSVPILHEGAYRQLTSL